MFSTVLIGIPTTCCWLLALLTSRQGMCNCLQDRGNVCIIKHKLMMPLCHVYKSISTFICSIKLACCIVNWPKIDPLSNPNKAWMFSAKLQFCVRSNVSLPGKVQSMSGEIFFCYLSRGLLLFEFHCINLHQGCK